MEEHKVSIIVPIYNAGKYIFKCISSLVNQTYKNLEIIAVNDCSSDNSLQLLTKYAQGDERIIIVNHPVNKGVELARLTGLEKSTGMYITFVDADDWLALNALELLVTKIEAENADMVTGAVVRVMDKYGFIKSSPKNNYTTELITATIKQPQLFNDYFISFFGVNSLFVSVCCKLYKKEVLKKMNYSPYGFKMGEDLIFSMLLHIHLNKITFVDKVVYYYRYGGMTSKLNPTFLKDLKKQYKIKEKIINAHNYQKALPYIKYELINCFYSYSLDLLIKNNFSEESLRRFINEELKDDIYTEVTTDIVLDDRKLAIKERNINKIVNHLIKKKEKEKKIYFLKQIISKLLN